MPAIHKVCGHNDDTAYQSYLHHADAAAVGADPGRTVCDPPLVLLEALVTDLEPAGAVPAERQLFLAAVAFERLPCPAPS